MPTTPNPKVKPNRYATGRPTAQNDKNAIIIVALTSVKPRKIPTATTCKPSTTWKKEATTISDAAISITSTSLM